MDFENKEANESFEEIIQHTYDEPQEIQKSKKLPLACKIIYIISAICVLLYVLFIVYPQFADIFNKYVSPLPRATLAYLTSWIPFSFAEYLLLLCPVILIILVSIGLKHYSANWKDVGIFCLILLSIAAYIFSTFTLGFVPAYRGSRLDVKMGLDKKEVSADELRETALILSDEIDKSIKGLSFDGSGASVMPYGYEEMNDKLMQAYDKACQKYDFLQNFDSNIKNIMLSEPMTYTHISGVYTFFTGEANLNTNFPDYSLPYTAAHEFAHQRGIAREDEANFVAFLVCSESDDQYIRYCAYMNLYEYVLSALRSANYDCYKEVYNELHINAKKELVAYSQFFDKYRDNVANDVSGVINNTFLTINGTEGTKSYGMVVDLAVAYYKNNT